MSVKKINPKIHDSLFKWVIASFADEFFQHYFSHLKILNYTFIDKEFISKYEALKESVRADLFLAVEIETEEGVFMDALIHIEHQSKREDVSKRVFKYLCFVWLLKEKPVMSIVIYTDDSIWRRNITEELLKDLFDTAAKMKDELDDEKKLLILHWADQYGRVSEEKLEEIKKEAKMEYTASSITEHYKIEGIYEGLKEGELKGKMEGLREGEMKGKLEGKLEMAKAMRHQGFDTSMIMKLSGLPKQQIEGFCIAEVPETPYGETKK